MGSSYVHAKNAARATYQGVRRVDTLYNDLQKTDVHRVKFEDFWASPGNSVLIPTTFDKMKKVEAHFDDFSIHPELQEFISARRNSASADQAAESNGIHGAGMNGSGSFRNLRDEAKAMEDGERSEKPYVTPGGPGDEKKVTPGGPGREQSPVRPGNGNRIGLDASEQNELNAMSDDDEDELRKNDEPDADTDDDREAADILGSIL